MGLRLKFYRPASVLQLLLIVLSLIVLPLILVLVSARLTLDRLAIQSRQAVVETVRIVEIGRMLMENVTEMERNARQFQWLGDASLYQIYLKQRAELKHSIAQLGQRDLHPAQRTKLNRLAAEEQRLYETLRMSIPGSAEAREALARFGSLSKHTHSVVSESGKTIGRRVEEMQAGAAGVQHLLFWQAAAVIPAVLAIAVVGILLIAKPMRRLERAVYKLGQGDWSASIEIIGPRDLEDLGRQIEWLRVRLVDLEGQRVNFLRHVSHELKTPLAALREGAELLRDEAVGTLNAAQADIAQILCRSGVELQRQIEGLLNFSAMARTPAALSLNRRPLQLARLVEKVIDGQKVALRAKQLRVEKLLDSTSVNGDWERLRVVMDNLLSNAIKYSAPCGQIRITLRPHAGHAVLEIQDQGPGIAPDERDKVFHPFYQGRAVPSGNVKGTGLGLSIAQEFVKAHQGCIEIVDVDRGAQLRVSLPSEDTDADGGSSP